MILHLVNDEKVINRTIDHFEKVCPGDNYVVCFSCENTKHVKLEKNIEFYYAGKRPQFDLSSVTKVVIHFLTLEKIDFCNLYIKNALIYWCVWGGDIYNGLLASKGYQLHSFSTIRAIGLLSYGKMMLSLIKFRITGYGKVLDFINNRINYISANDGDYDLLKTKLHISDRIKRFSFFYYPIDYILGKDLIDKEMSPNSKYILCGNSASYTNNHMDTLKKLKKLKNKDSVIVMPLSYGGNPKYINRVISSGKKIFNDGFKPLTDFMPINQYNQILQMSSICVFSNWRQEAFGNIAIALYLGAKVYMTRKNPFFNTLTKRGCKIYDIDKATFESFNEPLSSEVRRHNKDSMIKLYNSERLFELIRESFVMLNAQDC